MHLLIGTRNRGKVLEIREMFSSLPLVLRTPDELEIDGDPEETGTTYKENALIKARFYHEASGLPTIADDSGVTVEALQGELGVQTRRWGLGPSASDEAWIAHFLERMTHEGNRRAAFYCCIAYIDPEGNEHTFEGSCPGTITAELEAPYPPGLPFAACFRPDGRDKVYSALTLEQKNDISHRGQALLHLRRWFMEKGIG